MNFLRVFVAIITMSIVPLGSVFAADYISSSDYSVRIYDNNGEQKTLNDNEQRLIAKRIAALLMNATADTSEPWFLYEKEKHGDSLAQQWDHIQGGSHFSLVYDEDRRGPFLQEKSFVPYEVIVDIKDDKKEGFIGDVLAYSTNGDVFKAYEIPHKDLVSLYCYEHSVKHLPSHYQELTDKYDTRQYAQSGISCNSFIDYMLEEEAAEKRAKQQKWQRLREEKYGIKPTETEQ